MCVYFVITTIYTFIICVERAEVGFEPTTPSLPSLPCLLFLCFLPSNKRSIIKAMVLLLLPPSLTLILPAAHVPRPLLSTPTPCPCPCPASAIPSPSLLFNRRCQLRYGSARLHAPLSIKRSILRSAAASNDSSSSTSGGTEVFQGVYGPWSIDSADIREVSLPPSVLLWHFTKSASELLLYDLRLP